MGLEGETMYQDAMRNASRSMETIVMNEYEKSQDSIIEFVESFGDLANDLVDDFGCDEDCFEECSYGTYTYEWGETITYRRSGDQIVACAVSQCCSATDIVSADVTQHNMQCSINAAKSVQCFSADL